MITIFCQIQIWTTLITKQKFYKKVNVKDTFEFWYVFWFCNLNTLQCIEYCTLNLLMYKNSRLYQVACKMSSAIKIYMYVIE